MSKQNQEKEVLPIALDKFHEIELQKVFDSIEAISAREAQLASLFGTTSLAVLTVGFTTQKATLLFIAGVVLWLYLGVESVIRKHHAAYYYRGLQLQKRFAPNDDEFSLRIVPSPLVPWIIEIINLPKEIDRIKALHKLPLKVQSFSSFWIPLIASLIFIGLGIIVYVFFGWSLL